MGRLMENQFKVGDKVLLQLGADAKNAPQGLKRWDGCQFRVEKVCVAIATNNYYCTYLLKCCKSVCGVPYSILEEWLTRIG